MLLLQTRIQDLIESLHSLCRKFEMKKTLAVEIKHLGFLFNFDGKVYKKICDVIKGRILALYKYFQLNFFYPPKSCFEKSSIEQINPQHVLAQRNLLEGRKRWIHSLGNLIIFLRIVDDLMWRWWIHHMSSKHNSMPFTRKSRIKLSQWKICYRI